jgi:hypothetical protein
MYLSTRMLVVAGMVAAAVMGAGVSLAATGALRPADATATAVNGCVDNRTHALYERVGTRCPRGYHALTWNVKGPAGNQGPSGIISVTQYFPTGATPVTSSSVAFLGTPPTLTFKNARMVAQVTASVDQATTNGVPADDVVGICYKPSHGGVITLVNYLEPTFTAPAYDYSALPVTGDVGNLSGTYVVGLCASDQTNLSNGLAVVTITLAQTSSGLRTLSAATTRGEGQHR